MVRGKATLRDAQTRLWLMINAHKDASRREFDSCTSSSLYTYKLGLFYSRSNLCLLLKHVGPFGFPGSNPRNIYGVFETRYISARTFM